MMKFNLNKENVLKILKLNNVPSENSGSPELVKARRNIYLQAGLAVLTIVLTLVIIFSMTAAWYTNIVETSGLVFEVESWGYSGEVTISDKVVAAAPGDSGVVGLTVSGANEESSEILDVKVNVTKDAMRDEMQQRMFFYVDTAATENGENVERVYLSSLKDYSYTLFSGGSILMNDDFSNVPELKWQWVYDVLGYYVIAEEDENGALEVTEYIRPIEYDFDKATFKETTQTLTVDGEEREVGTYEIATVDGTLTPEEFLEEFSKNDGYQGTLNIQIGDEEISGNETEFDEPVTIDGGTFYQVGTDANGRGIYAHLCTYSEIEAATAYDTNLGELAKKKADDNVPEDADISVLTFEATVGVTVEQKKIETTVVSDVEGFKNAIENGGFVELGGNIVIDSTKQIVVPSGKEVWIDLGGNTITSGVTGTGGAIVAEEESSITLVNGKMQGADGTNDRAIESIGGEINLSGVEITGFDRAVNISDEQTVSADSTVRISGCTFNADSIGVFISGNGQKSEQKTKLIIEDTTITSKGYGISGNGSDNRIGTDIQIINSTIKSTAVEDGGPGIYHPQRDGTLTVYNSTVEGYTGIAIKGGYLEVISSEIIGNGDKLEDPVGDNSGSADPGDAIYIENNYEKNSISVVIREEENSGTAELKSTTVTSEKDHAVRIFDETRKNVKITIYGGTFSGIGDIKTEWLAEGMKKEETNGAYKVVPSA
ncbi:MAG: hypothetical protein IJB66_01425 [Oscillospiraceae bacterium]|nr:hypothetical protein [Oscillospiraceae bacterium]